jgi:bifunctional non-homologous end joining protein LigD
MPREVEPMLCTLVPKPFDRPNWIFEIKWDGYRAIAEIEKSSVRFYSRKLKSLEGYFPQLVETLSRLDMEAVIDGEVVVLDAEGVPILSCYVTGSAEKKITLFTTSSICFT